MKLILVMQICYLIVQDCAPPITFKEKYHDWYQCELAGLGHATDFLNNLGSELVNKNKVAINFTCINENKINKTSISSIQQQK